MPEATLDDLGGWPAVLGALTAGQDLPADRARAAMAEILDGNATPAQIAGFVVALRMKGETEEELSGLLDAMLAVSPVVPLTDPTSAVDIVGTGGDRSHSINVSTIAALVIAGAGGTVCKHGNRAASSSCGSADLLEAFGVAIDLGPAAVAACVEEAGIGFCFAPRYHASMRHAGPTRRELGVPTAFNMLGPLANPARVGRYVVGVADPAMGQRMASVLAARGVSHALVVHGDDGLDELTTTTTSSVLAVRDGSTDASVLDPAALGLAPSKPDDLRGGDPVANAASARAVLDGAGGPHRDVVLLNAAAGLVVAGRADGFEEGLAQAAESIDTGAAAAALAKLVAVSNRAEGD